jgi:hypothetical protein
MAEVEEAKQLNLRFSSLISFLAESHIPYPFAFILFQQPA